MKFTNAANEPTQDPLMQMGRKWANNKHISPVDEYPWLNIICWGFIMKFTNAANEPTQDPLMQMGR